MNSRAPEVAVPDGVVTEIAAVIAAGGIVATVMVFALTTLNVAATAPIFTDVAPPNVVPVIVSGPFCTVPVVERAGVKGSIAPSAGLTLKARVTVPPAVVTTSGPLVAPTGTNAWITVGPKLLEFCGIGFPFSVTVGGELTGGTPKPVPTMSNCSPSAWTSPTLVPLIVGVTLKVPFGAL